MTIAVLLLGTFAGALFFCAGGALAGNCFSGSPPRKRHEQHSRYNGELSIGQPDTYINSMRVPPGFQNTRRLKNSAVAGGNVVDVRHRQSAGYGMERVPNGRETERKAREQAQEAQRTAQEQAARRKADRARRKAVRVQFEANQREQARQAEAKQARRKAEWVAQQWKGYDQQRGTMGEAARDQIWEMMENQDDMKPRRQRQHQADMRKPKSGGKAGGKSGGNISQRKLLKKNEFERKKPAQLWN